MNPHCDPLPGSDGAKPSQHPRMNKSDNPCPLMGYHPVVRILLLARLLGQRFTVVRQSASWLCQWALEALEWLRGRSGEARAVDDEIEIAVGRLRAHWPLLERALANDAPALRRQILADLEQVVHAAEAAHAKSERLGATLQPKIPDALVAE